ncbi:ABC transporter permease [Bdellovibrio sp. ZAP7]|uniref:ABC transporter permease n=1 Tax=Bdellovibrio sp. ZAP7 TaxID=2231053 RepID=UPI00115B3640|nr:FtsX-like permease family protein [Bdellovibrio sp. ZAP7]QDK43960.1 ABC transporter permease [Bdellovibrio sp. ZAP7]
MIFRLAVRELIRSWRFGLFFIFNLSLGLTGFVSLQAFNVTLQDELARNAKNILSADLSVSARRELTEAEQAAMKSVLPPGTETGRIYEFFAMMSSSKGSRLVMVKAIDSSYPFYGALEMHSGKKISPGSEKEILGSHKVWIYPELQQQMNLQVGDRMQIGKLDLAISDVVDRDETQTFRMASLAPRVYVDLKLLPESGLIQFGSTFTQAYQFKLPAGTDENKVKEDIFLKLPDPAISVDTPTSAGEDSGRQLGYLSDYLGLVAIIALFMSALGAAYIYRMFLYSRMKEIAILRTLGLQSIQAVGVYVLQASLLGLLATLPTVAFSEIVLPVLTKVLGSFTPFDLKPSVTMEAWGLCLLMAVLGSFVVSLPFLMKIYDLKAAKLFSEEKFAVNEGKVRIWPFIPAILVFYGLSVNQAHSWKIGSAFAGSLVATIAVLLVAGYFVLKFAGTLKNLRLWMMKYSFLGLSRRAGASLAVFVALGLGALLINILPQLKNSLQSDLQVDQKTSLPSLFMFDIQDEQVTGIQKVLADNEIKTLSLAPMVRARVLKVNGVDYERKIEGQGFKTREEEREARFRNRGMNLSYRDHLSDSEEIIEGRPMAPMFDPEKQKIAELSVEERFADRMNFKLGDKIIFDVQGVEVEGEIVNFRKVKWTTFQPNFFVLVQNGVLNDAPKTFISALPTVSAEKRAALQNELAKKFANVSVIDVVRTVDEALKTADKMSWSLELMAYLALFTGYIVLFSIVRSQIKLRRWEMNMLKILGASHREVAGFILTEFAFLAFVSSFLGSFLSVGVSYGLNRIIFEGGFQFSLTQPLLSVAIITALSLLISFLASADIVKESALSILREEK